jgi:Domain of unknown function (DUF2019)
MTQKNLNDLDIDELIERFVEVAERIGHVMFELVSPMDMPGREEYEAESVRLFAALKTIEGELRSRGPEARLKLLPLYAHPSTQVQLSAAEATLAVAPELARTKLQDIAKINWSEGYSARSTLAAFDSGKFKPD